jgi:hypothetical protein
MRKLRTLSDDPVLADGLIPAAESLGVIGRKREVRDLAARASGPLWMQDVIHTHNATGKQVRESEVLLEAECGIRGEECSVLSSRIRPPVDGPSKAPSHATAGDPSELEQLDHAKALGAIDR